MSTRGPKVRTSQNSRKAPLGSIEHASLEPPCTLTDEARAEYDRLIEVLRSGGTLERVDLGCVANAARVKDLLDRAHKAVGAGIDAKKVKLMNLLTTQHRGLLRELGLTSQPSRLVFRATPATTGEVEDKWAGKLKIG
jgi:phage terminase small subunit